MFDQVQDNGRLLTRLNCNLISRSVTKRTSLFFKFLPRVYMRVMWSMCKVTVMFNQNWYCLSNATYRQKRKRVINIVGLFQSIHCVGWLFPYDEISLFVWIDISLWHGFFLKWFFVELCNIARCPIIFLFANKVLFT